MANHAWIVFRKNINLDTLTALLEDHNRERFDSCLVITKVRNGIQVTPPEGRSFTFWQMTKRRLEWKHANNDVQWWLTETLAHHMARMVDPKLVLRDEGISEKMEPTFDLEHPTLADWIHKPWAAKQNVDDMIEMLKPVTHPSYWREVSNA